MSFTKPSDLRALYTAHATIVMDHFFLFFFYRPTVGVQQQILRNFSSISAKK